LHDPFGDQINIGFHRLINLVEEFVQTDKVWAFHVPMGLFHLRLEVHRVRKPLVQKANEG
jgi:hypothetical protein